MSGRLYLGNQFVRPAIIGYDKIFNVDGYDWLGEINEQGKLVTPTKDINLVFNGVKELNSDILRKKFYGNTRVKSVSFPDLEVISSDNALYQTFSGVPLESIEFPKLKSISGDYAFADAFNASVAKSITFPELETISNDNSFSWCFFDNQNIKKIYFPKVKQISGACFYQFAQASTLEEVYFPELETLVGGVFDLAFSNTPLKIINFNSLKTAEKWSFIDSFNYTSLETVSFPLLSSIGEGCFYSSFSDSPNLKNVYFNSLNSNSFGENTDCFESMLYDCENVTVHFPAGLDATIGNWSDVLSGFDGINTTILYDL